MGLADKHRVHLYLPTYLPTMIYLDSPVAMCFEPKMLSRVLCIFLNISIPCTHTETEAIHTQGEHTADPERPNPKCLLQPDKDSLTSPT